MCNVVFRALWVITWAKLHICKISHQYLASKSIKFDRNGFLIHSFAALALVAAGSTGSVQFHTSQCGLHLGSPVSSHLPETCPKVKQDETESL